MRAQIALQTLSNHARMIIALRVAHNFDVTPQLILGRKLPTVSIRIRLPKRHVFASAPTNPVQKEDVLYGTAHMPMHTECAIKLFKHALMECCIDGVSFQALLTAFCLVCTMVPCLNTILIQVGPLCMHTQHPNSEPLTGQRARNIHHDRTSVPT